MQRAAWFGVGLFLMTSLGSLVAEPAVIDRIIQQLGSPDPKTRAVAQKALEALGPDALPLLRKALNHPDAEVRKRIGDAVPGLETALLIAPKLVTLNAENKTSRELLDELAKQTGYKIDVWNDNPRDLHTLQLDKVPFWKAADEIGRRSGLGPVMGYGDDRLRFQKENGFPAHVAYDGTFRFVPSSFQHNRQLTFRRIGETEKPAQRTDTLTLHYVMHAEPKTPLLALGEPQVQEAIDTEGASLMPSPPPLQDPRNPGVVRQTTRYGSGNPSVSMQGTIELGRSAEKAKGVKVLRAGIPLTTLVEQKPEVVFDKVLDVKNKKATLGSTTFNLDSCELTPEKQYRVKMSVTEEKVDPNDYTWTNTLYRRIELRDEKGNKYQIFGSSWGHSGAGHVQVTFNYGSPGPVLGPPRKMTYQMWKTMTYMVRVELRDLPLP